MKNATVEISESAREEMVRSVNEALKAKESAESAAERPTPAPKVGFTSFTPLNMDEAKSRLDQLKQWIGEKRRLALVDLLRQVNLSEYTEPKAGKVFGPCYGFNAEGTPLRNESTLSSDKEYRLKQIAEFRASRSMAIWAKNEVKALCKELGIEAQEKTALSVNSSGAIAYTETAKWKMSAPRGMACRF
jgi:hypothetical protein